MTQHAHDWDASYELGGTTYRECTTPGCSGHQQWICALDRWSDPVDAPSPRRRLEQQQAEHQQAPAKRG